MFSGETIALASSTATVGDFASGSAGEVALHHHHHQHHLVARQRVPTGRQ
jgi:hypothetical protein